MENTPSSVYSGGASQTPSTTQLPHQVCVIDGDVDSLDDVLCDQYHYTSIMVHFNNIARLDANTLCLLRQLQVIDLSANKLANDAIYALSEITSGLTHLNISSNESISSLQPLFKRHSALSRSLVSLDASFNFIDDNGLISVSNSTALKTLHLQGNSIETLDSVFTHIAPIKTLRSFYLQKHDRDKNPVCNTPDYKTQMQQEFIQLEQLDQGEPSTQEKNAFTNPLIESIMNTKAVGGGSGDEPSNKKYFSENDNDQQTPSICSSRKKSKIPVLKYASPVKGTFSSALHPVQTTLSKTHQAALDLQLEANIELQKSLGEEKHRRFRAEESTMKLEHQISSRDSEIHDLKGECERLTAQSNKLKEALLASKKSIERALEERDSLKKKLDAREATVKQINQKTGHIAKLTGNLEKDLLSERQKVQKLSLGNKELQRQVESNKVMQEELDHLKRKNEYLKTEHEMEIKKVKNGVLDDDNPEFRERCQKVLRQAEERMRNRLEKCTFENEVLRKQYNELENEFRQALVLESAKFDRLQGVKDDLESELKSTREQRDKIEKNFAIQAEKMKECQISVRESKAKVETMLNGSEEKNGIWKARLEAVEKELVGQRKLACQVEPLKQEKARLLSRVTAHESVMEGLKQERSKWTEELSQKGFELANERGRLEAKISSLQAETERLQKSTKDSEDVVRIKSKMIENQTTTIRELKQKIAEKVQYQDRADEIDQLQGEVRKLFSRKEELKFDNQRLKDQLETYQVRWKDKANVMERLEEQVRRMKKRDQDKIAVLNQEKAALHEKMQRAEIIIQKTEERFQQQLRLHDDRHEKSMRTQRSKFDAALQVSNEKILRVEDEMRQILLQQETERRKLEDKYRHVGEAFKLLQKGLN